jgi:hypothetical protein
MTTAGKGPSPAGLVSVNGRPSVLAADANGTKETADRQSAVHRDNVIDFRPLERIVTIL